MTALPSERAITADELATLPDNGNVYELSRGTLVTMAPTFFDAGFVAGNVMTELFAYVKEHGLGRCGSAETGFLLGTNPDTVRAPDAWFIGADRVPPLGTTRFFPGPPDLAVEVLSPSDRFSIIMPKVRDYMDANTPLVWVIDPESRIAATFRPGSPVRFVDESGALDGEDVLPGFRLPLAAAFS